MNENLKPIYLSDYVPYPFQLSEMDLTFQLNEGATYVSSSVHFKRFNSPIKDLVLSGRDLELENIAIDGRVLTGNEYSIDDQTLTIFNVPDSFRLNVDTRIYPEENTHYDGLYMSHGMYCTQCEPEGFRRITYFPDRPDVQSNFKTTIIADPKQYPTMLSNGNLIADEVLDDGRRKVTWHDPFNKPSYLFALIAGNLERLRDTFTTCSGRTVALEIYTEPHNVKDCSYAMDSLKRAMRWDEDNYGREYDLDIFMIAAVEHFNMGAMENKGLNIFNTKALLASPNIATDSSYKNIERIVAHEYFHNWSGNRVTCRDWFQLSLKEGFTVYRDSQFSADMGFSTVQRIRNVEDLRTTQFPEDAGPLAHPVRPNSYVEIANFYTKTVYEKGAEVVRMLHTLLGDHNFRRGTDLYFETHDGSHATTDDFVNAMENVSGQDLSQFRYWYSQSGTPRIAVTEERTASGIRLTLEQHCEPSPGHPTKKNFHIPIAIGAIDAKGNEVLGVAGTGNGYSVDVVADMEYDSCDRDGTLVMHLRERSATISFNSVPDNTNISFLRGFSAPVIVDYTRLIKAQQHIAIFDTDGFAKWNAGQKLLANYIASNGVFWDDIYFLFDHLTEAALDTSADSTSERKALLREVLTLPHTESILDANPGSDIADLLRRREKLELKIAESFEDRWTKITIANIAAAKYAPTQSEIARRSLFRAAFNYLVLLRDSRNDGELFNELQRKYMDTDNLTERLMVLNFVLNLRNIAEEEIEEFVDVFYQDWRHESLIVDQWLAAQAQCSRSGGLARIKKIEKHEAFDYKIPNRVRALYNGFTDHNVRNFHDQSGDGYRFIAEKVVELDQSNPSVAARVMTQLSRWQRFDESRKNLMCEALEYIRCNAQSKDVQDVVTRSLADKR